MTKLKELIEQSKKMLNKPKSKICGYCIYNLNGYCNHYMNWGNKTKLFGKCEYIELEND